MADEISSSSATAAQARAQLQELARLLDENPPLDPDTRQRLASLVNELSAQLSRPDLAPAEAAHLMETVRLVSLSLERPHERGLVRSVRDRLQEVVARAEAEAPTATRFAEQLIEILANLGI
jgi:hypothetical protein